MQGLFVTLEGPEGSGKSTQAQRLAARLAEDGREVVTTREPGGTPLGEALRHLLQHAAHAQPVAPEAELFLFMAGRAQLVRQVIRPALARGAVVICDRFGDSTTAYQGYGRGLDVERILAMNAIAMEGTVPRLTLLLDLDVRAGFERMCRRNAAAGIGADRFEREELVFHERVRAGYLALARRFPERFRVIGADRDPDVVHAEVWSLVR